MTVLSTVAGASSTVGAEGSATPTAVRAVPEELLHISAAGLPRTSRPRKRVIVIGAGLAGLVSAFELARAGHQPVVLEAQGRVGGRVHTLRDFAPGLYAEAGAMRIPRVHSLALAYCRQLGIELRPIVTSCPEAYVYIAGRRRTVAEVKANPALLGFELAPSEAGKTFEELLGEATRDVVTFFGERGEEALLELADEYDGCSIRDFLTSRGFSEGAIELFGLMSFREANLNACINEYLRELVGQAFEDMQEVVGGADRFPLAFFARLKNQIRLGAHVVAVTQDDHSVTVRYRTRAGTFTEVGDYAVCTLPFAVARHVDFVPALSREKYRAIRELNYNPSTKIIFQVRRRFWERSGGIIGGTTTTDLPVRRLIYPSHAPDDGDRGVFLASYTWGQDAARWGSLSEEDRIALALKDVAKIHPEVLTEFELGRSYAWYNDPYAGGAFALFEPGQQKALHHHIVRPEGRIHFAGEHCSLWHAWIQGALESGVRAALAVDHAPDPAPAPVAP